MIKEKLGAAWLKLVSDDNIKREEGLKELQILEAQGDVESAMSLALFETTLEGKEKYLKKAAATVNAEALWQYSNLLNHNHVPDLDDKDDMFWMRTVLTAARKGSVDAMLEMGNIFNRLSNYVESFYWYFLSSIYEHPQGELSASFAVKNWVKNGESKKFKRVTDCFKKEYMKTCFIIMKRFRGIDPASSDLKTLLKNAQKGDVLAALFLGKIYENNNLIPMAIKMFNIASMEKDAYAMRCMADIYMMSNRIQDAFSLYEKAAELGEKHAMFVMGEVKREKNKNEAAYWYALSHIRGYDAALERLKKL